MIQCRPIFVTRSPSFSAESRATPNKPAVIANSMNDKQASCAQILAQHCSRDPYRVHVGLLGSQPRRNMQLQPRNMPCLVPCESLTSISIIQVRSASNAFQNTIHFKFNDISFGNWRVRICSLQTTGVKQRKPHCKHALSRALLEPHININHTSVTSFKCTTKHDTI